MGAITKTLTLGIVIGFIAGFGTCLTWVEATRHEVQASFDRGRQSRDLEAYQHLQPLADMYIQRKLSDTEYYLEPTEGGRVFHVVWCDPINLREGWVIRGAVTEKRRDCLSLHMEKAEIKVDRTTTLAKE